MSAQAAGDFLKKIDEDTAFRDAFFAAVPKEAATPADVAAYAKSKGFDFSAEDLSQVAALATGAELSDAQLEAVAGGISVGFGEKWRPATMNFLNNLNIATLPSQRNTGVKL
jgi:predicted ribosomally synthesized peptide with nif11-like leader